MTAKIGWLSDGDTMQKKKNRYLRLALGIGEQHRHETAQRELGDVDARVNKITTARGEQLHWYQ